MTSAIESEEFTMNQQNNNQNTGPQMRHEPSIMDIEDFIATQETVPSSKPRKFSEQFVIVTSGGSSRAYIYDTLGLAWRYTTLT
jgi:hypothetical protein